MTDYISTSDNNKDKFENISSISLVDEMKKSYLDYAMSVIVSRALPDCRDCLKPVHRRILYAMNESGYNYNKGYKNLHGIDPDQKLLNQIPKKIKTSIQYGQKTNLESNSFDVVFIYCVFHHVGQDKDYFEVIDEVLRVLKPNGYLFICEPGRRKTFIVMEFIIKILELFSKLFKSYDALIKEEKNLVHYFLKNHYKVRDKLREKKFSEIINTYKFEKWLYVCQKTD